MGVSWVCRRVNHKYDQLSHSQSQLARREWQPWTLQKLAHNQHQNTIDPQTTTENWDNKCHVTSDHQIIRLSNDM